MKGNFRSGGFLLCRVLVMLVLLMTLGPSCTFASNITLLPSVTSTETLYSAPDIRSLSGLVHIVISAGTIGTYKVEGTNVEGLYVYFASISPVLETTPVSPSLSPLSAWRLSSIFEVPSATDVLFNESFNSCAGWKNQEYIFRVQPGATLVVTHPPHQAVGRVCASRDGTHYTPTSLTYEVLDVQLKGFVELEPTKAQGSNSLVKYVTLNDIQSNPDLLLTDIGFTVGSSGGVQVVSEAWTYLADELAEGWSTLARYPQISHVRFSSSADCSSTPLSLFSGDLEVQKVDGGGSLLFYSLADVWVTNNSFYEQLSQKNFYQLTSSPFSSPGTFYVCVAVNKKSLKESVAANDRLDYSRSLNVLLEEENVFTLVPGLYGYLRTPDVYPKGMWVIPHMETQMVGLLPNAADSYTVPSSLVVYPLPESISNGVVKINTTRSFKSVTEVHVDELTSPLIGLDMKRSFSSGMNIMFVRSPSECSETQLDYTVAVSHIPVQSFSREGSSEGMSTLTFFQLNTTVTTFVNPDDAKKGVMRWFVCLSTSAYVPIVHLNGWSIVVHRDAFLIPDASHDIILSLSSRFSGPLYMPLINLTYWSSETISKAAFSLSGDESCGNILVEGIKLMQCKDCRRSPRLLVPPLGFLALDHNRTYRLCLSISPYPILPTAIAVYIEPPHLSVLGHSNDTVLEVVLPSFSPTVIPVRGTGLSPVSSILFLSEKPCEDSRANESLLNLTVYGATTDASTMMDMFVVWPAMNETFRKHVFSEDLLDRYICLLDGMESGISAVVETSFKIRPIASNGLTIRNTPDEVTYFTEIGVTSNSVNGVFLVYGSSMTLSVSGYHIQETELILALDCSNTSTFLSTQPIPLEPLSRRKNISWDSCANPLSCYETWYVHLYPEQTIQQSMMINTAEWCYRSSASAAGSDWKSAGTKINMVYPSFSGFLADWDVVDHIIRLSPSSSLHTFRLAGPQVRMLEDTNIILRLALIPVNSSCDHYSTDDMSIPVGFATSFGEAVLEGTLPSDSTVLRLCYAVEASNTQEISPSKYLSIPLDVMKVEVDRSVALLTQLNEAEFLLLPQEEHSLVSVSGVGLTQHTVFQFVLPETSCLALGMSSSSRESGIAVFDRCHYYHENQVKNCPSGLVYKAYISKAYLQALTVGQSYKVCFQTEVGTPWLPSPVTVRLTTSGANVDDVSNHFWTKKERSSMRITPEGGVAIVTLSGSIIHRFVMQGPSAAFSVWCEARRLHEKEKSTSPLQRCSSGLRVALAPMKCNEKMVDEPCTLHPNWYDDIWGPMSVVDGALVVTDVGRKTSHIFWGLMVETASGEWEPGISDFVLMTPTRGSNLSFSDVPQLPSPFNISMTTQRITFIQNTPSMFYLTGYGIQGGVKLRFGALCEHEITQQDMTAAGVDSTNVSYLIRYRQKLNNSVLYTNPISVADSSGAFYVPLSYVQDIQIPTPVCISLDGGNHYHKSDLQISVEKYIPKQTLQNSEGLSELLSQSIFLYEGASGLIALQSVEGSTNWHFKDGTQILMLPCDKAEIQDDSVVLTWPSPALNISSTITSNSGEHCLWALPIDNSTETQSRVLTDLGVRIHIIKKSLSFSPWSDYFVSGERGVAGGVLKFQLTNTSSSLSDLCSDPTRESLADLMNNEHFLHYVGGLQIYFTNNSYCRQYVGNNALDENSSTVLIPSLLDGEDGSTFYIPVTSSLPLAPLGGPTSGLLCISVDGGRHFIDTSMRYFTGDVGPTLLLGESFTGFTTDLVESAGSAGLRGLFRDTRCAVNDIVCLNVTHQLWSGFFSSSGWIENGAWIMNGPYRTERNVPIIFESSSGIKVNTGATVSFEMPELRCAGAGKDTTIYIQQSNSGYIALIPPECQRRLTTSNIFRLVPVNKLRIAPGDLVNPCDDTDHKYLLELTVIKPADWVDSTRDALGLQWPHSLRYVPTGLYHLCVGGVDRNQFTQVAVMVNIGIDKPIRRIGQYATGVVPVYQGSNARFLLEGQAIVLRQEVLISYAPAQPTYVEMIDGTTGLWDNGCYDIPVAFNLEGSSLLSAHQPFIEDYLLTTPFTKVEDHWLEIPASSLRYANSNRSFFICYSLNGGITFEPVSNDLRLVVLPPTIQSIASFPTFNFSLPPWTSFNSLSVQRFVIGGKELLPKTFVPYGRLTPSDSRVMVHSPLYYTPEVIIGFTGDGLGIDSGREWLENTSDIKSCPTFAASVAVLRSSMVGSACNKMKISNESVLASPFFILNLNTGKLWDDSDVGGLEKDSVDVLTEMNPVLSNSQWKLNTEQLIREGGINLTKILENHVDFETFARESFIVCLSLDGVHYYSPNFLEGESRAAQYGDPVLGPLVVVPQYSSFGSASARDITFLVTLIKRNSSCNDTPAFSVNAFQRAIGKVTGVDPSVLVVQVQKTGCTPSLSTEEANARLMPIFVLSVSVSTYGSSEVAPPAILLDVVNSLHHPLIFSNLTEGDSDDFGVVEVNFYYSDGQNLRNVSIFSSPQEEQWHKTFSAIPTDGVSVVEITSSTFDNSRDPLHWQVIFPVILFPILLIMGTLILYNKYLATEIPQWCCGRV